MNRIVPIKLKYKWIIEALLAFLFAPIEEIIDDVMKIIEGINKNGII